MLALFFYGINLTLFVLPLSSCYMIFPLLWTLYILVYWTGLHSHCVSQFCITITKCLRTEISLDHSFGSSSPLSVAPLLLSLWQGSSSWQQLIMVEHTGEGVPHLRAAEKQRERKKKGQDLQPPKGLASNNPTSFHQTLPLRGVRTTQWCPSKDTVVTDGHLRDIFLIQTVATIYLYKLNILYFIKCSGNLENKWEERPWLFFCPS